MEESYKASRLDPLLASGVEAEANYEGNDTELLIERLENPIIRDQVVDLHQKSQTAEAEFLKKARWKKYPPEKWMESEQSFLQDEATGVIVDSKVLQAVPQSRDEIEKDLDGRIKKAKSVTAIEFSDKQPNSEAIGMNWEFPGMDKLSIKQKSIIEAHEKGHQIREYYRGRSSFFDELFKDAFDPSSVDFTQEDYERIKIEKGKEDEEIPPDFSFEVAKKEHMDYLFSALELAERMSQLKNYFGINGAEEFTKAHLDYARTHYVQDTNFDNSMTHLFQAITPGKEEDFLKLINSAGI